MKRKKLNSNRAFTMIELMIAVAIMALLATTGTIALNKRAEKNAIIQMKTQIPTFFENAAQRSYEEGKSYNLDCEFGKNLIKISDSETGTVVDKLNLDSSLTYFHIKDDDSMENDVSRNITATGGISKGFSIFIFNKKGIAIYKIAFSTKEHIKYIGINKYNPKETMLITELSTLNTDSKWEAD